MSIFKNSFQCSSLTFDSFSKQQPCPKYIFKKIFIVNCTYMTTPASPFCQPPTVAMLIRLLLVIFQNSNSPHKTQRARRMLSQIYYFKTICKSGRVAFRLVETTHGTCVHLYVSKKCVSRIKLHFFSLLLL